MKRIAWLLVVAFCLCGLTGCRLGREDSKVSPSMSPSILPDMEDGNVDDNGSEDGVLNTDKPESPAPSASPDVSGTPENPDGEEEPSTTQPPVNSVAPEEPSSSPETGEDDTAA